MTGHRLHVRVRGRVQGVGFRWFTASTAQALGVAGWVRNCPDGSVEVLAEGEADALVALRTGLQAGPPGAMVTGVEPLEDDGPTAPLPRPFEVRRAPASNDG